MKCRLFYFPEGFGNVGYDFPPANAAHVLDAANDGLSTDAATSKIAQLGQTVGRVGNPAQLLEDREIPLNAFGLLLSGMTGANPAITIQQGVSPLDEPQLLFLDNTGAEIGRITFNDQRSIAIGPRAGANMSPGGTNGKILIGNSAGHDLTTADTIIAIGSGAMQGTGAVNPSNIIGIGNDVLDRNGGAIGNAHIVLGNNSLDGGAAPSLGVRGIFIGHSISSGGGNAVNLGDDIIVIGHSVNPGAVGNIIVIGNLQNGTNKITIGNIIILGDNTKNTLIGFPTNVPWVDNGNRVQVKGNVWMSGGIAPNIRTTTTAAETFGALDYTIIADATAGNINVNVDPTITTQRIGNLKKKDATVNTVTLTALSGQIFGLGAPAASFSMGAQGQSISFQSDGTNIYVI